MAKSAADVPVPMDDDDDLKEDSSWGLKRCRVEHVRLSLLLDLVLKVLSNI